MKVFNIGDLKKNSSTSFILHPDIFPDVTDNFQLSEMNNAMTAIHQL